MAISKDFENGVDKISQEVSKAAENVKETASDFGGWWKKSSLEEKISTFIWVILIVWALIGLSGIVFWVILLTLGILCVTGYFEKPLKNIINWFKTTCNSKKTKKKEEEKLEKVEVEEDTKDEK